MSVSSARAPARAPQPAPARGAGPARPPALSLVVAGGCLAPVAFLIGWSLAPAGLWITLAVYTPGLALAARSMARDYPHAQLGGANLVTTLRLAFCAAMAAAMAAPGGPAAQAGWPAWGPTLLALLALSLDGIDGWLARRQALSSQFGARYDMEVDSALAAVLAALLVARGTAGPEMLVLGGARYAFVAAAQLLPWLGAPLPESLRRKTVCVVQIAALVALTAPILPVAADRPIAIGAALLVAWSFAVDIRWLVRRG